MQRIGIVRLAPGKVAFYDSKTKMYLTIQNPVGYVYAEMDNTIIKNAVKCRELVLEAGVLSASDLPKPIEQPIPVENPSVINIEKIEEKEPIEEPATIEEKEPVEEVVDKEVEQPKKRGRKASVNKEVTDENIEKGEGEE